jgi:hypothetical protein
VFIDTTAPPGSARSSMHRGCNSGRRLAYSSTPCQCVADAERGQIISKRIRRMRTDRDDQCLPAFEPIFRVCCIGHANKFAFETPHLRLREQLHAACVQAVEQLEAVVAPCRWPESARFRSRSRARRVHTAGVTGSIPVRPTRIVQWK